MRPSSALLRAPFALLVAVSLIVLPAGESARAQQIGLKGGLNLADFVGNDAGDSQSTVGLNAGGSFQILQFGPVSFGPELFYAQKGSERQVVTAPGGGTVTGTSKFNLAYVEVPVLLTVRLIDSPGSRIRPFVHAGPVFGWNLNCTIDFSDPDTAPEETCASLLGGDIQSTLEDYEQGITFGGGLDVAVVPGQGALTLAVGNIIGGNSFDVLFVAFADGAYRSGSIYHAMTNQQVFVVAETLLLTGILLLGLLRRQKHGIGGIGFESILVLVVHGASVLVLSLGG